MKMTRETKFLVIATIFIATMAFTNLTGSKITSLFGLTFSISAFFYAITFPCTDLISECWGKTRAQKVVWLGFIAIVLAAVFTQIAVAIPPADFWAEQQEAYASVFRLVGRLAAAGLLAYIASQTFDVWFFHWWRDKTQNKHLWLRNNASTMVSQFIDTSIFITIAFIGTIPFDAFLQVIFGQYIVKVAIAAIDTPVIYWLRGWIGVPAELIAKHQQQIKSESM